MFNKSRILKLINKVKKNTPELKGWIITGIYPENKKLWEMGCFGAIDHSEKILYIHTGVPFNVMATTLLHEVAHIVAKSWEKENHHDEEWGIAFTSIVDEYMKVK